LTVRDEVNIISYIDKYIVSMYFYNKCLLKTCKPVTI
jgi:hypothetical protein